MNTRYLPIFILLLAAALPCFGQTITDINELARKQLRMKEPQTAQLVGPYADTILRETHASGPINVKTELVHLIDAECGRIQAVTTVKNVPRKDGQIGDFWTKIQFDICKDGNPPDHTR